MLNNTTDFKSPLLLGKIVSGIVEDNNDPLFLGRIKVRVENLHSTKMTTEQLPWVLDCTMCSNYGSQGSVHVPDIGAKVWVIYQNDDLYSGLYLGSLPNITLELQNDYPNSYGMIDRSGSLWLANTNQDMYEFYHVSGTRISIDGKGAIRIQATNNPVAENANTENPETVMVEVLGDIHFKTNTDIIVECKNFKLSTQESIIETANTSILQTTPTYTITDTTHTLNTSNLTENVSGAHTEKVGGALTVDASGGITENSGAAFTLASGAAFTVSAGAAFTANATAAYTFGGATVTCNGLLFQPVTLVEMTTTDTFAGGSPQIITNWIWNNFGPAVPEQQTPQVPPVVVPPSVTPPAAPVINPAPLATIDIPPARERQQGKLEK